MKLRGTTVIAVLLATGFLAPQPAPAAPKSCSAFNTELAKLRTQYHDYSTKKAPDSGDITFDGLVEILDKIVALKGEMRKAGCTKIPPNPYATDSGR